MFEGGAGFWDLAAGVTQPVFEGGTLLHRERAARAAYIQAAEQYRSTVLTAFQNVADTLNALQQDAEALKTAAAARDAAAVTLDLAKKQYQSGYVNYLALLNAEQTYQQAVITLVQAHANRYADTAALFQALGGGWWNLKDISKNRVLLRDELSVYADDVELSSCLHRHRVGGICRGLTASGGRDLEIATI